MPCGVVADDGCGEGRAVGNRLRSGTALCKDNCVGILDDLIYGVFKVDQSASPKCVTSLNHQIVTRHVI
jgi:hypothetical protein